MTQGTKVKPRPEKPVRLNLDIDPSLHRRLKVMAAETGCSIAELVRGWIADKLDKAGSKHE